MITPTMNQENLKIKKYKYKPRVAVGVFLLDFKSKEVLLLKRNKQDNLADIWSPVCGKLEYLESIENGIKREAKEELGIDVNLKQLKFLCVSERLKEYPHYIVLWHIYPVNKNKLKIKVSPSEFGEYSWFTINSLPDYLPKQLSEFLQLIMK